MSDLHDKSLRDVPTPDGLTARLRAIPAEEVRLMSDEGLDEWLRGVPTPADLLARCRRVVTQPRRRMLARHWALAASLMLAIGLSYATSMAAFLLSTPDAATAPPSLFAEGALQLAPEGRDSLWELAGFTLEPVALPPSAAESAVGEIAAVIETVQALDANAPDESAPNGAEPLALASVSPDWLAVGSRFPTENFHDGRMMIDSPNSYQQARPRPLGAEPPPLPAFRLWQQATGFHPEVATATPELAVSRPPLDVTASGFFAAQRSIRQGALPRPESVRVEDFLAAMDYGFTAPSGQPVALRTVGGPSPFGGDELHLLQVAVFAPPPKESARQPTWLTVVLDGSGSLRRDDRAESVRHALIDVFARLQPDDRISLIVYHQQAETLADQLSPRETAAWISACHRWEAESSADLLRGLRSGYALAQSSPDDEQLEAGVSRRLVLISDGGPELEQNVARRLDTALTLAAREGIALDVIDVTEGAASDLQLTRCASAGGGRLHRASSAEQISACLLETLTGVSQTVATSVTLTVTFDPAVVATWRLLGHEARSYQEEWLPAATAAELHAGQTSTALYELRLWPNQREVVAEARLHWHDPRGVVSREAVRTVRRVEFASTFAESAPSLQAAALAAETAEVLRHSYFAQASSLKHVADVAREANPALRKTAAWQEWLDLVLDAQRIKPARSGSRRPRASTD